MTLHRASKPKRPAARTQKWRQNRSTAPHAIRALRISRVEPMLARQAPTKLAGALGLKPIPPPGKKPAASSRGRRIVSTARRQLAPVQLPALSTNARCAVSTPPVASAVPQLPRMPRPPRKRKLPAATKASGLRAAIVRRQAAEAELREAASCRDAIRLASGIVAAGSHGVSPVLIKEAEHVLASCQRIAAEMALRRAIENERPDVDGLSLCIETARKHSVSKSLVAEAEKLLPRIREGARQRRAAEAAVAMCKALNRRDPDEISACIAAAREAGAAKAMIEDADNILAQIREELAKQARKLAAESDLQDAINSRSLLHLPDCIQKARDVGVQISLVQNAEVVLDKFRREDALHIAMQERCVKALESAIAAAPNFVAQSLIAKAEVVLRERLEEIERQEEAESDLCMALDAQKPEDISRCISRAKEAGVLPIMIEDAERVLLQIREALALKAERQSLLESALQEAALGGDVEALASCIDGAQRAGLPADIILQAESVMQGLVQTRNHAEEALSKAVASRNNDAISDTLAQARIAGVRPGLLLDAEQKLQHLQEELIAERALQAACDARDADKIRSCINTAESFEALASIVWDAKILLQSLLHERTSKSIAPKVGIICDDIEFSTFSLTAADEIEPVVGTSVEETARAAIEPGIQSYVANVIMAGATARGEVRDVAVSTKEALRNRDRVCLAPNYQDFSEAKRGPLRPGNVGKVIQDDGLMLLVVFDGKEWWYEAGALRSSASRSSTEAEAAVKETAEEETVLQHEIQALKLENEALKLRLEFSAARSVHQGAAGVSMEASTRASTLEQPPTAIHRTETPPVKCVTVADDPDVCIELSPKSHSASDIFTEPGQASLDSLNEDKQPAKAHGPVAAASATVQQEKSEAKRLPTPLHSKARRKLVQSYLQGCLAPALMAAFAQKVDFEASRRKTHDLITEAVRDGKLNEALHIALDSDEDAGA